MTGARRVTINAATACFPGRPVREAIESILQGAHEPLIGRLSHAHIQLCPQNGGQLDEAACERLRADYPATQFRLHANARVLGRHVRYDASTFGDDTKGYFFALADRSKRLGAAAYTLHAGFRRNCTLLQMIDNIKRIQDIFGEVRVGVEGLYPNERMPQLMDDWNSYHAVLDAGIPLAIDLSHMAIVERAEASCDTRLLSELLASKQTLEVHLSDNDGRHDRHDILSKAPWWWPFLTHIHDNAVVFSEGNQLNPRLTQRRTALNGVTPTPINP